jgi:A/G-specific adenine glycosylase
MIREVTKQLMAWYSANARDLPWRNATDPYSIWVAEVMLQQTRVDTVLPYYQRWLTRFPTIQALALANQQDVLQVWEGLGYYSRARNFHLAAQTVLRNYDGMLPSDPNTLQKLPGIGKAGAADLASIAFGVDIASVDGNIRRVVSRLLDLAYPLGSREFETAVQEFVDENLPPGQAGDYNQAWMDLGSSICTPTNPNCLQCPLSSFCASYQMASQNIRPVKPARKTVPEVTVTAGILLSPHGDQVLLALRPEDGLLGGLWEFPGGKQEGFETIEECLIREWKEEMGVTIQVGRLLGVYRHAYSHFKVILRAHFCTLLEGTPQPLASNEIIWASLDDLASYPMGKIDRNIAKDLAEFDE